MGFKSKLLTVVVLVLSSSANAATIALEDWWLQTDDLGGLRQTTWNDTVYFAVSQSITWDPSATYEAPAGYHVASTAEGLAVFTSTNVSGIHAYYNQGGWSGYNWEGQKRYHFRFSDSDTTNAYKHAGNYEEYFVQYTSITNNFAGLVLIADTSPVPVPAATWLFGSGLIGLIGVARRKKS